MADADESADDQCPNTNEENILSTTLTPNITDTTESNMTVGGLELCQNISINECRK